jgi:hypothetical protein
LTSVRVPLGSGNEQEVVREQGNDEYSERYKNYVEVLRKNVEQLEKTKE